MIIYSTSKKEILSLLQVILGKKDKLAESFTDPFDRWTLSHSYTIYGPLLIGATTVLYEGKPIGTPDAGVFWRIVSEYGVKTMFTAPTAIRAIAREDQEGHLAKKYSLDSLTSLFLAGERSDPQTLSWCQTLVGDRCTVIDNYWSTECEYEKERGGV